ncbi:MULTISPECIES: methyltransferase domain-containing protein [unclassified Streptomyces]|uniref:methyltransferase domain-containing protein n=1 Tax=unclassified Streptomyces TaxID=2593676 RepID=UPI002E2AC7D9|nr:methyltransferase domain-containing protein [Streptomyces sp. NBC_00223]
MTAVDDEKGRSASGRRLLGPEDVPAPWASAFAAVPRAAFLPDLMWPFDLDRQTSVPVSRAEDPAAWREFAEADVPIVTQWDDGDHEGRAPGRVSTSSVSMPSVVLAMLDELSAGPGDSVLEIGTGAGWNAALLSHVLGDAHVTTVEVDAAVAATARAALERAGFRPTVITGDGFAGHAPRAPYSRIIATCGLREIPYAWVEQTAPGGTIVVPWGTHFGNGDALVRLEVADGVASGRFTRLVEFMKMRGQRTTVRHGDVVPAEGTAGADESTTTLAAEEILTGRYASAPFVLGLLVPGCVRALAERRGDVQPVWFYGLTDRSWAVAVFREGRPTSTVWQAGPRRLWDEVEGAVRWWQSRGCPAFDRFGLTVGPAGQRVWLDEPGNRVGP